MSKSDEKIFLQPSYTKFRTVEKLKKAFEEYPQQIPSTPEAFDKGLVADFKDPYNDRIVSAHEIKKLYNFTLFKVRMLDGNVVIVKEDRGKFFIKIDKKR